MNNKKEPPHITRGGSYSARDRVATGGHVVLLFQARMIQALNAFPSFSVERLTHALHVIS